MIIDFLSQNYHNFSNASKLHYLLGEYMDFPFFYIIIKNKLHLIARKFH